MGPREERHSNDKESTMPHKGTDQNSMFLEDTKKCGSLAQTEPGWKMSIMTGVQSTVDDRAGLWWIV